MAVGVVHAAECDGIECGAGCRFVQLKSLLDPVALPELAAAIRDETWLDMRVAGGRIYERVQVERVIVHRDHDEVTLIHLLPVGVKRWTLDAEDIQWMRPTVFDADEAERPKAPADDEEPETTVTGVADDIYFCVRHVLARWYKMTVDEIDKDLSKANANGRRPNDVTMRRHVAIWLMYELTDESAVEICTRMGYRSPMAFHSARDKFTPQRWGPDAGQPSVYADFLRDLVRKVREMGGYDWRRRGDVPDTIL